MCPPPSPPPSPPPPPPQSLLLLLLFLFLLSSPLGCRGDCGEFDLQSGGENEAAAETGEEKTGEGKTKEEKRTQSGFSDLGRQISPLSSQIIFSLSGWWKRERKKSLKLIADLHLFSICLSKETERERE